MEVRITIETTFENWEQRTHARRVTGWANSVCVCQPRRFNKILAKLDAANRHSAAIKAVRVAPI